MNIRTLKAEEIEVRVQMVQDKGYSVLLYKDARCDMRILDETFGMTGWQRKHEIINNNLFCTISIYDDEKKCWIEKQDVGMPSFSQAEKGEASDAFKRAGFNVGIGRELYTAPFIWINAKQGEISDYKGKKTVKTKLAVSKIAYSDERKIIGLELIETRTQEVRYSFGNIKQQTASNKQQPTGNSEQQEKEKLKMEIVTILKTKKIQLNTLTEYLQKNFNTIDLLSLNINQIRMLKNTIAGW